MLPLSMFCSWFIVVSVAILHFAWLVVVAVAGDFPQIHLASWMKWEACRWLHAAKHPAVDPEYRRWVPEEHLCRGGDGAEFVYTFVVEALKVGRVGVDEVRRLHPSLSRQCQQWQGRRSWLKARLVVMVADVVGNEMPSCGACLGNGCGGTGGAPTCGV